MKKSIQNTSNVNLIMIDEKLYQERLKHIEEIENKIYNSEQTDLNNLRLNIIYLDFSRDLLEKYGTKVKVNASKITRKKFSKNNQLHNARRICFENQYGYVEGIVINKIDNSKIAHIWNVDLNGNHVDMTIEDPQNYEYIGIQIPENLIYQVGYKHGGKWRFNLPFLQVNLN